MTKITVPENLINGLNNIIRELTEQCKLYGYRYIIGDPEGAHMKEFDDSGWAMSDKPVFFNRNQGVTWFRLYASVPESIGGIPVAGSGMRLSSSIGWQICM